ncbi:MAG: hypothetical protein GVY09_11370, partial [Gammaproteobacteria bacterium]|nr:hypothetical protein [Gammaproteobacteria bacterium]
HPIELCERDGTDVLTTLPDTTAHPDDNAWQRKQLDLAIPTIDSADSTAWLNTLHEKVPPALIEAAQRTRELAQQTRRE